MKAVPPAIHHSGSGTRAAAWSTAARSRRSAGASSMTARYSSAGIVSKRSGGLSAHCQKRSNASITNPPAASGRSSSHCRSDRSVAPAPHLDFGVVALNSFLQEGLARYFRSLGGSCKMHARGASLFDVCVVFEQGSPSIAIPGRTLAHTSN